MSVNQIDVNAVNQRTLESSIAKPLLFLDTEATGVDVEDRVVQVAYRAEQRLPISGYFKAPLPVKLPAMAVNNITNKMLADKEPFIGSIYYSDLDKMSSSHILVAHNAIYDLEMLAKEGLSFESNICTLKVAFYLDDDALMEKHTLSYLRYFLDTDVDAKAHDAVGDIVILEAVFWKLFNELKYKELSKYSQPTKEDVIAKMVDISNKPTLFRKFNFGKYNGEWIKDVAQGGSDGKGRSWMKWLLEQKMSNPVGQEGDWIYTLNYFLNAYEPAKR